MVDSRQLVVAAHHPDRLRWPAPQPGGQGIEPAVLWNVFRALELVAPAFWLRRLQARLSGAPLAPAPQIVEVSLWRELTMPPALCLDRAQPSITIDVWIETEHAAWALLSGDRIARSAADGSAGADLVARALDAAAWHAGARKLHAGAVESVCESGSLVAQRYARSSQSARTRSALPTYVERSPCIPGALSWSDLALILADCADALMLSSLERAVAREALVWLDRAGVSPLASSAL